MTDGFAASYVLLLGVVAAFNPCGFALLPAYLTIILTGSAEATVPRSIALRRAIGFGLAMTLGTLAVFTAFGLLFGAVNLSLQATILPYLSYITVVVGVALTVLGFVVLITGELRGPGLRVQLWAPRSTFWSQIGYGVTFAIASLSCTIGLFLAVVSYSLAASNPVGAAAPFIIYGLGMGATVVAVSLVAALAGTAVAAALRSRSMLITKIGGVLMIIAGLYVIVYGLAEILPRHGIDVFNTVLLTSGRWQSRITTTIQSWGAPLLMALVAATALVVGWVSLRADGGTRRDADDGLAVDDNRDASATEVEDPR